MRILLLVFLSVALVASSTRFDSTEVNVQVVLRCKNPKDPTATVFLMERDFDDSKLDEDDTMDFEVYRFGTVPEMKISLRGQEFEFSGLDPYLHITHSCTNQSNTVETFTLDLMDSMYRSRTFDVIIDLDTKKPVVVTRMLYN